MTDEILAKWQKQQLQLKSQLILTDKFEKVKYLGGVDLSFIKTSAEDACACFVILSYPEMKCVYEDYQMVKLTQPYIPGYLAFREVDFLERLVMKVKTQKPEILPQIILVDGNGILHPQGFGLASHLGVLCDIATIGVSKKVFHLDGLTKDGVRKLSDENLKKAGDFIELKGNSGQIYGASFRSTDEAFQPIYISIGHKISLETSIKYIKDSCLYRIPEPVRKADLGSREFIRKYEKLSSATTTATA